jgi:hypothetical protein
MKKINQLYFFFLVLVGMSVAFSSCEEEDLSYQGGDAFYFRQIEAGVPVDSISVSEELNSPIAIPIVFTKTSPVAGSVTVEITSSTAILNQDYVVLSPSLTFDFTADQYADTLFIQTIPNTVPAEDKVIYFTLVTGTASLGFSGETGTNRDSLTLNLEDDDAIVTCPTPSPNLAGSYSVTTTYGFHDFLPDYATNTMTMDIVDNGDGTYTPEDFSGGLYGTGPYVEAYGTTPLADVAFTGEISGNVSWSGASDPWGALVMTDGGVNAVDECGVITISWTAEGYGENGVSVYSPL